MDYSMIDKIENLFKKEISSGKFYVNVNYQLINLTNEKKFDEDITHIKLTTLLEKNIDYDGLKPYNFLPDNIETLEIIKEFLLYKIQIYQIIRLYYL